MLEAFSNYDESGRESGWLHEDDEGEMVMAPSRKKKGRGGHSSSAEEGIDYSLMESFEIDDSHVVSSSPLDSSSSPPSSSSSSSSSPATGTPPPSLAAGLSNAKAQLADLLNGHISETYKDPDVSLPSKLMSFFEAPYTLARSCSVCLTSENEYSPATLALSTSLSPLWLAFYAHAEHGTNAFSSGVYLPLQFGCAGLALLVVRFCPSPVSEDVPCSPPLVFQVPLALYGFVVAATWIDFVADQLVSVLTFLGIFMGIPPAVLGLTVLAWGNSIGDLSTNMSMARRGLSNMSITACFAGPIFNFLIGLGAGFNVLLSQAGKTSVAVTFDNAVWVGLAFMIVNCVGILVAGLLPENNGEVPKKYGYVGIALYVLYVIVSLLLQL